MRTFTRVLFSTLLVVSILETALAAKLTVVTEHLAPFQIVDSTSITGLSTEIVEATFDKSGYEYIIEAHPWSLSFNRAKHKENICIYSLARIPERLSSFQWVGHLATSSISIYALKKNNITIASLEEAKQYKTAVIKDDVTHHYLLSKGFVENENLYVMSNYDALLLFLETPSRKIDLVLINDDLINNRVATKEEAGKYINVYVLEELSLDFYLACSLQTNKNIVNNLADIMKNLELSGVNSRIRNKWRKKMVNLIN